MSLGEDIDMTRKDLCWFIASCSVVLLCCASPVLAQPGTDPVPIVTNFRFDIPIALTVAHPCRAGFVLIKGTTAVELTTSKANDFRMVLKATATGTGEDAMATGALLTTTSKPYDYSADSEVRASFPDGTPAMFAHSLTVLGELIRSRQDAFTIVTTFDLEYTNGIPTTLKLKGIDVSCN